MIVADANLLVAIVAGENTATAEAVLAASPQWHAPVLWRSEIANVLVSFIRKRLMTVGGAQGHWSTIAGLVAGREHQPSVHRVLSLAAESGCTAYDCEYVIVAEALALPLVTFDREILRAFPQIAMTPSTFLSAS